MVHLFASNFFGTKDFETCIILPKNYSLPATTNNEHDRYFFTSKYCARDSC